MPLGRQRLEARGGLGPPLTFAWRLNPAEEADQVPVLIERGELAGAEVGVVDTVARDGMQHLRSLQLCIETVNAACSRSRR